MKFHKGDKVTVSPYAIGDPKLPNRRCWATIVAFSDDGDRVCVVFSDIKSESAFGEWYDPGHLIAGHLPDPEASLGLLEKERAVLLADPTVRRRDAALAAVFGVKTAPKPVDCAMHVPVGTEVPREYGGGGFKPLHLGYPFRYNNSIDYMPIAWGDYSGSWGATKEHMVWADHDGCFWLVPVENSKGIYRSTALDDFDGMVGDVEMFAGDVDTAPDVRLFTPRAVLMGFRFQPK